MPIRHRAGHIIGYMHKIGNIIRQRIGNTIQYKPGTGNTIRYRPGTGDVTRYRTGTGDTGLGKSHDTGMGLGTPYDIQNWEHHLTQDWEHYTKHKTGNII